MAVSRFLRRAPRMLAGSFLRDRHTLYRVLRSGHVPGYTQAQPPSTNNSMPLRAAVVGGQEQDGLRDFISGAETAIGPGVSVCAKSS